MNPASNVVFQTTVLSKGVDFGTSLTFRLRTLAGHNKITSGMQSIEAFYPGSSTFSTTKKLQPGTANQVSGVVTPSSWVSDQTSEPFKALQISTTRPIDVILKTEDNPYMKIRVNKLLVLDSTVLRLEVQNPSADNTVEFYVAALS